MRLGMRLPPVMHNLILRQVFLLAGFAGVAFGLTIPFLTLVARERGVSLAAIGLMASSYLIAQTIFQLPFGALSDRIGRTIPMAVGFAIEGVAAAGFVFADSAGTFIALRVVQGISLAFLMPALRALVADLTRDDERGQAFAWLFASFSGGLLLGPPVGGILASPLGRSPLFLLSAALNLLLALVIVVWLRRVEPQREANITAETIPFAALFTRALIGAFILGFGARILEGLFVGIWSIYMADIGASDLEIGLSYAMWSIAFLIFTPWGGRLADRGQRWRKLLPANLVMAVLMIAYGQVQWVPLILLFALIEGALSTVTIPALDAYLASVADPRIQGRVQGTFATIGTFGAATSAFAGTALYDYSQALPFAVAGGALIVLTLLGIGFMREGESRAPTTSTAIPG